MCYGPDSYYCILFQKVLFKRTFNETLSSGPILLTQRLKVYLRLDEEVLDIP